jgi:hypothetical protein
MLVTWTAQSVKLASAARPLGREGSTMACLRMTNAMAGDANPVTSVSLLERRAGVR